MRSINLASAGKGNFRRTRSRLIEALWIITEWAVVTNALQPSSRLRVFSLRLFGANIGRNVILRPRIRVKYPWLLSIGARSWIGEGVWIHNQAYVHIQDDVVISQETFLTTGSHDTRSTMNLLVAPIEIHSGAWVTARCVVLKGVVVGRNAIVTPGSVVAHSLPPGGIYRGNPCQLVCERELTI